MIANNTLLVPRIESRIQVIRGLRVMLDVDLAATACGNFASKLDRG